MLILNLQALAQGIFILKVNNRSSQQHGFRSFEPWLGLHEGLKYTAFQIMLKTLGESFSQRHIAFFYINQIQ